MKTVLHSWGETLQAHVHMAYVKWMTNRFGHRGTFLILMGTIWFVFGLIQLLDQSQQPPQVLHQYFPAELRGGGWISTAAVAIIVGLHGRGRDDSAGFTAIWVMPAIWMFSYGGAWVIYLLGYVFDITTPGYSRGILGALVWLIVVTMLRLCAAWPNPTRLPTLDDVEE